MVNRFKTKNLFNYGRQNKTLITTSVNTGAIAPVCVFFKYEWYYISRW